MKKLSGIIQEAIKQQIEDDYAFNDSDYLKGTYVDTIKKFCTEANKVLPNDFKLVCPERIKRLSSKIQIEVSGEYASMFSGKNWINVSISRKNRESRAAETIMFTFVFQDCRWWDVLQENISRKLTQHTIDGTHGTRITAWAFHVDTVIPAHPDEIASHTKMFERCIEDFKEMFNKFLEEVKKAAEVETYNGSEPELRQRIKDDLTKFTLHQFDYDKEDRAVHFTGPNGFDSWFTCNRFDSSNPHPRNTYKYWFQEAVKEDTKVIAEAKKMYNKIFSNLKY